MRLPSAWMAALVVATVQLPAYANVRPAMRASRVQHQPARQAARLTEYASHQASVNASTDGVVRIAQFRSVRVAARGMVDVLARSFAYASAVGVASTALTRQPMVVLATSHALRAATAMASASTGRARAIQAILASRASPAVSVAALGTASARHPDSAHALAVGLAQAVLSLTAPRAALDVVDASLRARAYARLDGVASIAIRRAAQSHVLVTAFAPHQRLAIVTLLQRALVIRVGRVPRVISQSAAARVAAALVMATARLRASVSAPRAGRATTALSRRAPMTALPTAAVSSPTALLPVSALPDGAEPNARRRSARSAARGVVSASPTAIPPVSASASLDTADLAARRLYAPRAAFAARASLPIAVNALMDGWAQAAIRQFVPATARAAAFAPRLVIACATHHLSPSRT